MSLSARLQHLPVAEFEQRVAAKATHIGAAEDGIDKPFESAGGCRARIG
jgi:hypothetical protein